MKSIVRQLPKECTPDLNNKQREILLKRAFYELPGGDSDETIQYTLDTPILNNYISFGFYFTTGQSGFGNFELKKFKTTRGTELVIFSKYGGARAVYSQDTLKVFTLINGKLIENKKQNLLPQAVSIDDFLKKEAPDSIKKLFENSANPCYYLNPEKPDQIEFNLYFPFMPEDLEKWLVGDSFVFVWNGRSFKRSLTFKD